MPRFEVIYLTGPPASGKTTLVKRLCKAFPHLRAFIYSEILSDHISKRERRGFTQEKLRANSSRVVTPEDIEAVDHYLVRETGRARRMRPVIIDSHPVTKEEFGFRVTAFSLPLLDALRPTRICMLFAKSSTVIRRIQDDRKGRPHVTKFEADFHCFAQASLAVCYGIQLGVPVYFYDSSRSVEIALREIGKRIQ